MAGSSSDRSSKPSTRHRAFDDVDDEDDSHHRSSTQREEIVSFGRDGAQGRIASPSRAAAPRVIPLSSNLDWRQDRKRRLGVVSDLQSLGPLVSMRRTDSAAVPGSHNASTSNNNLNIDAINTEAQKRGLELRQAKPRPESSLQSSSIDNAQMEGSDVAVTATASSGEAGTDQEALQALLAGDDVGGSRSSKPLIISQEADSELLQHDIDSRPDAPSLDDYEATPIDQFGIALLRGMGWKEGMGAGKGGKGPQQAAEPKKRAALLGLGAKERPLGSPGLSSSSAPRAHRPKDRRDYQYMPVTRGDNQATSNGGSNASERRPREEKPLDHRSTDSSSSRNAHRGHRDGRHANSRESSRHHHASSSRRHHSRSPTRSRDDEKNRDRLLDRHNGDSDTGRRSHASSRSDYERRYDRARDDKRKDFRR